MEVIKR